MSVNYKINKEYLLSTAKEILEFNSPTGFCFEIMDKIEEIVGKFDYKFERNNKGGGIITIEGNSDEKVIG
ncbi:aminopeptidase, partial [Clostridium saudiense]|nr:aminopeptidase [Clostridium saudiense]